MSNKFDANTYQELAMRTANKTLNKYQALTHGITGLCSECGEVASFIQKMYQGKSSPLLNNETRRELLFELGDVLWMCAEIAHTLDTDLNAVMSGNIMKLKKRYPEGFEKRENGH